MRLDLFGEAIPAGRGKRGRPAHVWSIENSNKINLLFATGHDHHDAAAVLGISAPTLRKHYFFEIERHGAAKLRLKARLLAGLSRDADQGNTAAAKELFKQIERGSMPGAAAHMRTKAKPKPLGKKDQALVDARSVGGEGKWGGLLGEVTEH